MSEKSTLPKLWKCHTGKLSGEMKVKNLMAEWDRLNLSWNNTDILGFLILSLVDPTVVNNAKRFLLRP